MTLRLTTLAAAIAVSATAHAGLQQYSYLTLERVRIENPTGGSIKISQLSGPKLNVTDSTRDDWKTCNVEIEHEGAETLVVKVAGPECPPNVDLNLEIPKELAVDIKGSRGNIDVEGLTGKLSFETSTGNVTARGKFASVDGTTDSGSVNIHGLMGGGKVSTKSGDIALKLGQDAKGTLDVASVSGSADVEAPAKMRLHSELSSEGGKVDNQLDDRERSDYQLKAKSESGDIKVKGF